MALGASAIADGRNQIGKMRRIVEEAINNSNRVKELFKDGNFQMFATQSNYGSSINEALENLSKFLGHDLAGMVDGLCSTTSRFLDRQEMLNNQRLNTTRLYNDK